MDRDDEDARRKARNAERLQDDGMSLFTIYMAAAMAGGKEPGKAAFAADQAIAELKKRFT